MERKYYRTSLQDILALVKCNRMEEFSAQKLTSRSYFTGDFSSDRLTEVLKIAEKQQAYMIVQFQKVAQEMKSELLDRQKEIIGLQSDLITAREQQLSDLKSTIESVEKSVKSEIRLYREAVATTDNSGTVDRNMLKQVFKDVVAEEDWGRNFMIFGLEEEKKEPLPDKVTEMLSKLGEKQNIEVSRLGQQSLALKKKFVLPVKVTVANSTIVQQILRKSRHPRHHDQYKTVFISPDRSAHERAEHKRLGLELKEKAGQ